MSLAKKNELKPVQSAQRLPHREKYLLLATGFMRRYLELHLELIDAVEREMTPAQESSPRTVAAGVNAARERNPTRAH